LTSNFWGLFNRNLSLLASPKYCDIQSGNPTLIRKYITTLSARLAANDIPACVALLASTVDNLAAEQLDAEVTDAMLAAGKVCAHTARLPMSPQLHEAQTRHRIFQEVLTQLRTHRDSISRQITKQQRQLPEHVLIPTDINTTIAALRSSRRELQDLPLRAYKLREQHQSDKADAIAISDNIGAKAALDQLQQAEATK
jgi:hypothetical protein